MTPPEKRKRTPQLLSSFPKPDDGWVKNGLCVGHPDPDLWFREGERRDREAAKRICWTCPVRPECAAYSALIPHELIGVWGGYSQIDRERGKHRE